MPEQKVFGMTVNLPSLGKKDKNKQNVDPQSPEQIKDFSPKTPSTNLLPPSVVQKYKVNKSVGRFLKAGVALIVLLAIGYVGTLFLQSNVEQEIAEVEAVNTQLSNTVSDLAQYRSYADEIDSKRAELYSQFNGDLQFAEILDALQTSADDNGIILGNLAFGISHDDGSCTSPDPFTPSSAVGCISLSGSGNSSQSVNGFTSDLNAEEFFVDPYFPTVTLTEEGVDFDGSVGYNNLASASRYTDMSIPIQEQLNPSVDLDPEADISGEYDEDTGVDTDEDFEIIDDPEFTDDPFEEEDF